jgi:hypothetical protein
VRIVRCTVGLTLSFCLLAGCSQQAAATDDLIVAIATLLTRVDPITVTEISVVFSAVALPLTYLPILIVANDPEYLGEHVNGRMLNGVALVYLVIILVASIAAIPLLIIKHFLEGPSSPALRNPCQPACPVLIAGLRAFGGTVTAADRGSGAVAASGFVPGAMGGHRAARCTSGQSSTWIH